MTEIRLSDRESYRFGLRVFNTGAAIGGCVGETAFDFIDGTTTGATLEILDNRFIFHVLGSGELLDDETMTLFDPGRVRLTTIDGRKIDFDRAYGGITRLEDANGNTLSITPNGITHSSGKGITFTRDTSGRITQITDPMANTLGYEYDAHGDLSAFIDQENNRTESFYDTRHNLIDIHDPLGNRAVRSEYDADGRLVRMINSAGGVIAFTHDIGTRQEIIADMFGNLTTYVYDARGNVLSEINPLGAVTERSYDDRDNLLTEADPFGNVTSYTYDQNRNITSQTNPLGQTITYTYGSLNKLLSRTEHEGMKTSYEFDRWGNVRSKTDPAGNAEFYLYDGDGNPTSITDSLDKVTQFQYDTVGNRLKKIDALGTETAYTYDANGNKLSETVTVTTASGPQTLVTSFDYDLKGNLTSIIDPEGNKTEFLYDGLGNRIEVIDPLGRRTKINYDLGQITQYVFSDGQTIDLNLDIAGRQVAYIDSLGRTTQYTYNELGKPTGIILPDNTPLNDADNGKVQVNYDTAGRLTDLTTDAGVNIAFQYDTAGRNIAKTTSLGSVSSEFSATGKETSRTDMLGRTTRFVYDELDRKTQTIFPDGSNIQTAYDPLGNTVSKTDQLGNTTLFEYDSLRRLTAVIDALGNRTEYGYDEAGRLISQKDANGHITRYEFDGRGRRTAIVLPEGQRAQTHYDAVGNVTSTTDFNGATIDYEYDARNRMIRKLLPDGAIVEFTYFGNGLRKTVTENRGITEYNYDVNNRLLSVKNPDGKTISYTYSENGLLNTITSPSGTTSFGYDALARLQSVDESGSGTTFYHYDAASHPIRIERPDGSVEIREYDQLNRLTYLNNAHPDQGVVVSYTYTYDLAGNVRTVTEWNGRQVEYRYDALNRLTQESVIDPVKGNVQIDYAYDAVGNRLSKNHSREGRTIYAYDIDDRLLSDTLNGETYNSEYDANGNLVARILDANNSERFFWDSEDRLIGADINRAGVTTQSAYRYDADGIRVAQIVNGSETRYLNDINRRYAQVLEEYSPGQLADVRYIYAQDLLAQNRNGNVSFYDQDGHSGVRALTDPTGAVTDRYDYDAYGLLQQQLGSTTNNFGYRAEWTDPVLNKQYLRARYYDPDSGRFLSRDPFEGLMEIPMTRHRYLYGNSNPVIFRDPSGQFNLIEVATAISAIHTLAFLAGTGIALGQQGYGLILSKGKKDTKWDGVLADVAIDLLPPRIRNFVSWARTVQLALLKVNSQCFGGGRKIRNRKVISIFSGFAAHIESVRPGDSGLHQPFEAGLGEYHGITPNISDSFTGGAFLMGIGLSTWQDTVESPLFQQLTHGSGNGIPLGFELIGVLTGFARGYHAGPSISIKPTLSGDISAGMSIQFENGENITDNCVFIQNP
ncbi:MAG: RHS repeat-associated core domain-containing protein [Gammaproteobacteria bacterium]